jgi:hypothetical protein
MMKPPKFISELKPANYNPRIITAEALSGLKYSLEEFGDLSGITFNLHTGNLVTGHQRLKVLKEKYSDLKIIPIGEYESGRMVTLDGSEFRIRFVSWPIEKEKAANVAANSETIQGEFTAGLKFLVDDIQLNLPESFRSLNFNSLNIPLDPLNILPGSMEDQGKLDEKEKIKCPECGYEFCKS